METDRKINWLEVAAVNIFADYYNIKKSKMRFNGKLLTIDDLLSMIEKNEEKVEIKKLDRRKRKIIILNDII